MALRQFDVKPLAEAMPTYWQMHFKRRISVKLNTWFKKCIWKCRPLGVSFCSDLSVLNNVVLWFQLICNEPSVIYHDMMTSSCGNILRITGPLWGESTGRPSQRPVTLNFDVFFDPRLNKRLSKQSRRQWFETPSLSLWRHCNNPGIAIIALMVLMALSTLAYQVLSVPHKSSNRTYPWWRHQMETFSRYWPFVWGIHRSPVNSPHKGQWHGALMFSLICVWINGWVNNRETGDLRRYRAHYGVIVMSFEQQSYDVLVNGE